MNCDKCGVLEFVLMDGYPVGDTLLEGIQFRVIMSPDSPTAVVEIQEQDRDYMARLNTKKWLKAMKDYAEDKNTDTATCPKCGDDVDWPPVKEAT